MIEKLSIIIPVYNEALTVSKLLDEVKDVVLINDISKEMIIVNDCSSDGTSDVIKSYIEQNTEINIKFLNTK